MYVYQGRLECVGRLSDCVPVLRSASAGKRLAEKDNYLSLNGILSNVMHPYRSRIGSFAAVEKCFCADKNFSLGAYSGNVGTVAGLGLSTVRAFRLINIEKKVYGSYLDLEIGFRVATTVRHSAERTGVNH